MYLYKQSKVEVTRAIFLYLLKLPLVSNLGISELVNNVVGLSRFCYFSKNSATKLICKGKVEAEFLPDAARKV
jgi:hypothetical protein